MWIYIFIRFVCVVVNSLLWLIIVDPQLNLNFVHFMCDGSSHVEIDRYFSLFLVTTLTMKSK